MKTLSWICILGCITLGAAGRAAEQNEEGLIGRLFSNQKAHVITENQAKLALSIRDYLGKELVNAQGEELGKIIDLTLKDSHGTFENAIVSVGGFLNFGDVLVAVPYANIQRKPGTSNLIWDVPLQEFQTMIHEARERSKNAKLKDKNLKDPDVRQVESALRDDKQLADKLDDVHMSKENGKLVLQGKVDSMADKNRIVTLAKKHASCEVVDNLIAQN